MPTSIDEKRKSIGNSKSEILEARVVANYGDPGLYNNYHQDLLSRFVIVCIESCYRIPTIDKWTDMFAIVARPEHLWISCPEGKSSSPSTQVTQDYLGNTNVGVAGSFSTNGIGSINNTYELGELIKIKKLPISFTPDNATAFFLSVFPDITDASLTYGSYHSEGSNLSYFAGNSNRTNALLRQNIYQPNSDLPLKYIPTLYRDQYHAFMLTLTLTDPQMSSYLGKLFGNSLPSSDAIYNVHGGYLFATNEWVNFLSCDYIDINVGNKQRITEDSCLPLITCVPNSFPTPRVRTLSTISFNPSYSPIVQV